MLLQVIGSGVEALIENWFVTSILFYVLYRILNRETRNVPPGPWGLPIVGYIPFFSKNSHLDCIELSKKYGPIFSIQLGLHNAVIISDIKMGFDVFNSDALLYRPETSIFSSIVDRGNPITWNGAIWKEHRDFLFRGLRQVGIGKPKIERLIQDEIRCLCDTVVKFEGRLCPLEKLLTPSVSNVVMAVTVGERYNYDHPTRILLDKVLNVDLNGKPLATPFTGYINNFIEMVLFLKKYLPLGMFTELKKMDALFIDYCKDVVARQIKEPGHGEDIVSAYLDQCDRNSDNKHFNMKHIPAIVGMMIAAGSGTVKDLLEWICLCMALYPGVQQKVFKEINANIGIDREPTYSDRQNMPFVQAAINESIRKSSFVPIGVPRMASKDVEIGGYLIPKGTHVYINNYSALNDQCYWKDPENYRPERFLNEDQTKLIKHDVFLPYSTGRRQCPGESLAQIELFLYVCYLFQRFEVSPVDGTKLTDDAHFRTFTLVPNDLSLKFTTRK